MDSTKNKTGKKIIFSALAVLVLIFAFCTVSYAVSKLSVEAENNYFQTGNININLNDGEPVINAEKFEPGMTVTKEFFIENKSSWEVYYKIYFDEVDGELADVLEITLKDKDKVLFSGYASEFSKTSVEAFDDALAVSEKKTLSISFYYPKTEGNTTQATSLSFKLVADAVQTKNNDDRLFE